MSEGNGHRRDVYPVSQDALAKVIEQMHGIFAQALREGVQNRTDNLIGKGKTVAELVANIDNESLRSGVRDTLLLLKIDSLLAGLQHASLDLLNEVELQEIHTYLHSLHERASKGHEQEGRNPDSA
jgi:hypothetical protein